MVESRTTSNQPPRAPSHSATLPQASPSRSASPMTVPTRRSGTSTKHQPSSSSNFDFYATALTADSPAEPRPASRHGSSRDGHFTTSVPSTRNPSSSGAPCPPNRSESVTRTDPRRSAESGPIPMYPDTARPDSRRSSRPGSCGRGGDSTSAPTMPPPPAMEPLDCICPSTLDALALSCRFPVLTFGSQLGRMQLSTPRGQQHAVQAPMQDFEEQSPARTKPALVNLGGGGMSGGMGMTLGGSGGSGGFSLARRSLGAVAPRDDAEPAAKGVAGGSRRGISLFRTSLSKRHDPESAASDEDSSSDQDMYHLDEQGPRSAPFAHPSLAHSLHHHPPGASEDPASPGHLQGKPGRGVQQLSRPYRLPPLHQ